MTGKEITTIISSIKPKGAYVTHTKSTKLIASLKIYFIDIL